MIYVFLQVCETCEVKVKTSLCLIVNRAVKTRAFLIFSAQLTLRRLMSYIYMEYPFLMFLDHTQRRSTVGRTPLDE